MVRRLRTTDCGKFDSLEKYVFEHGEEDATGPEFSADPLHQKKHFSKVNGILDLPVLPLYLPTLLHPLR